MKQWPETDQPRQSEGWLAFEFVGIVLAITFVGGWTLWSWLAS